MLRVSGLAGIAMMAMVGAAFADPPVPVTIEQLLQAPAVYADKQVLVRGQLDNCVGRAGRCWLCPEDMTASHFDGNRCLSLAFGDLSHGGEDRSYWRFAMLMAEAFRFADVTIVADFSPPSLAGRIAHNLDGVEAIEICTDWCTDLGNAMVQSVNGRKSALDGLVTDRVLGGLRAATADEAAAMRVPFDEINFLVPVWEVAFFVVTNHVNPDPTVEAEGLGCVCKRNSCDGVWPTRWFDGFESPANPFDCYILQKRKNVWRVQPTPP